MNLIKLNYQNMWVIGQWSAFWWKCDGECACRLEICTGCAE